MVGGPRCSLYMVYSLTKLSDPEYEHSEAERPFATLPLAEGKKGCLTLRTVMRKEGNGMRSS